LLTSTPVAPNSRISMAESYLAIGAAGD
jgi:hypothetical protein